MAINSDSTQPCIHNNPSAWWINHGWEKYKDKLPQFTQSERSVKWITVENICFSRLYAIIIILMTNLSTMDNFTCSCCHLVTCFVGECGTFFFYYHIFRYSFTPLADLTGSTDSFFWQDTSFMCSCSLRTPVDTFPLKMMKNGNLQTKNALTLML